MKVKDLMSTSISYVTPLANVMEVSIQMSKHHTGMIPVCHEDKTLMGVITDRDIITRYFPDMENKKLAKDIMTTQVITTTANASIAQAAEVMARYKVRRLLVEKNNRLVGVLSIGDLAKRKLYLCEVGDIYNSLVIDD